MNDLVATCTRYIIIRTFQFVSLTAFKLKLKIE